MESTVSAEFDYAENYLNVLGHKIHYIEQGSGSPIIFLHGIPSWSYMWRNVIPYLSDEAQCFAFDFLGFGLSDKPEISYDFNCYVNTLAEFIRALNLDNVTLVMHGFGGIVGSIYARDNPDKIKGLAYLESHIGCQDTKELISLPVQNIINDLSNDTVTKDKILETDYYLEKVMKPGFMGQIGQKQWHHYKKPFEGHSRVALWDYLNMLPYGDHSTELMQEVKSYSNWLSNSSLPKLMMVAMPGFIVSMKMIEWAKAHIKQLAIVDVGEGLHYLTEYNPDVIGLAVHKWYERIPL